MIDARITSIHHGKPFLASSGIDDERDTYGVGLDVNDTYSESDTFDEVRAILSDPAKHGFDKLIESKRTA